MFQPHIQVITVIKPRGDKSMDNGLNVNLGTKQRQQIRSQSSVRRHLFTCLSGDIDIFQHRGRDHMLILYLFKDVKDTLTSQTVHCIPVTSRSVIS